MYPLRRTALLFLTLLPLGCGFSAEGDAQAKAALQKVVQDIGTARLGVAHSGVRRVEAHWEEDGAPTSFVYREAVDVDGLGGYDLRTLAVLTPMSADLGEFLLQQDLRAGFFHRYRDAYPRDPELLVSNYELLSYGDPIAVAGREGVHFALRRTVGAPIRHDLIVDPATGLVLHASTFDELGQLTARVEYETLQLGPPPPFQRHIASNDELVLPLGPELDAALGFAAELPSLVPDGYQLLETARIVDAFSRTWLKATYSDGMDVAFYLSRPASSLAGEAPVTGSAAAGLGAVSWTQRGESAPQQTTLHAFRAAGIQVLDARLPDRQTIAVGRVPSDDLQWMIESVWPRD